MKRAFGIVLCCLAVCIALVSCGSGQLAPGGSSAAGVRGSEPIGSDEVASEAVAAAADDGNAVASEAGSVDDADAAASDAGSVASADFTSIDDADAAASEAVSADAADAAASEAAAAAVVDDDAATPEADPAAAPDFASESDSPIDTAPHARGTIEIVCWGDSLTSGVGASEAYIEADGKTFNASGLSYPEILWRLTGMPTYNFGVDGATSEEIVYMQSGIEPEGGIDDFEYVDQDTMRRASRHKGDILVLEIGSNGGWGDDYQELIEQYNSMIAYADCDDYIILGDTDDPGTSVADRDDWPSNNESDERETAWEAALREEFGDHVINMRLFLIERGLQVAGLEPTPEDERLMASDCVPEQLRSDWTHLNSYGYYAKAIAVYERGQQLGYWD